MRTTVVQISDATPENEWTDLVAHCTENRSQLVVLGEMPFAKWLAATDAVDPAAWRDAIEIHDEWVGRLGELGGAVVAGSRPGLHDGIPYNEGFLWSESSGYVPTHLKYYLPNEPGFWEATWYRRSPTKSFKAMPIEDGSVGFMICTDMWFTEHARSYAQQGVNLLIVPRATEGSTVSKWLAGGRAAAVMSGAFCLSSNRQGLAKGVLFGGSGWVIDPNGNVLATTSEADPFVTVDVDLAEARAAKQRYPRYVEE
ncbi:MAG: carbon-nitrogen hydrolase family protein [Acidimicrobiia bacterium]|nr:carbon-nitrogen hydrolase family protein [Acidimicrobiia bacterium]